MTPRQLRFVEEYLVDLNATQAAIRSGYSPKTARQAAAENMSKPVIRDEISRRIKDHSKAISIVREELIAHLEAQLRADIIGLFSSDGAIKPVDQWPIEFRQGLVKSFKVRETCASNGAVIRRIFAIRFTSRMPIIYLLGKHLGAWIAKALPTPSAKDAPLL